MDRRGFWAAFVAIWTLLLSACDKKRELHVVAYTAVWCKRCQLDKSIIAKIERYASVRTIDTDRAPGSPTGVPLYVVYCDGTEVARTSDARIALKQCQRLQAH